MLDKIRRHDNGELPLEYEMNLGKGFDEKCTTFLRVRYELVVEYVNPWPQRRGNFAVVFWDGASTVRG